MRESHELRSKSLKLKNSSQDRNRQIRQSLNTGTKLLNQPHFYELSTHCLYTILFQKDPRYFFSIIVSISLFFDVFNHVSVAKQLHLVS